MDRVIAAWSTAVPGKLNLQFLIPLSTNFVSRTGAGLRRWAQYGWRRPATRLDGDLHY